MKRLLVAFSTAILLISFQGCKKENGDTSGGTGLTPINPENDKSVGYSAYDFLNSSPYTSLKVEIQYMPGYQPDGPAVNNLLSFLNTNLNKTTGITLSQAEIPSGNRVSYSLQDIAGIEKQYRTAYNSGNQLSLYILVTDGNYADNNVLGVAYRNTSFSIFGKKINSNSGGVGQASRTKVVSSVLEHEMGHLLGLVDLGSPMMINHVDGNGGHCNNDQCLMYYATETTDVLGFLITGSIPTLDDACKEDLKANGAK